LKYELPAFWMERLYEVRSVDKLSTKLMRRRAKKKGGKKEPPHFSKEVTLIKEILKEDAVATTEEDGDSRA